VDMIDWPLKKSAEAEPPCVRLTIRPLECCRIVCAVCLVYVMYILHMACVLHAHCDACVRVTILALQVACFDHEPWELRVCLCLSVRSLHGCDLQALRSFATVPEREPMLDKFLLRTNTPQVSLSTPYPGVKVPTEYVADRSTLTPTRRDVSVSPIAVHFVPLIDSSI